MEHERTTLHVGMLDKVSVASLPQSRRFLLEWSLLLASIWIWSLVSWSTLTAG